MGGNVTVDLVHLPDGRVLGVNDECVVLYASIDDFLSGGASHAPTIDLLENSGMKTYNVTICHMAYATIQVQAQNEDEANNKAWDEWDGEADDCASNDITNIEEA